MILVAHSIYRIFSKAASVYSILSNLLLYPIRSLSTPLNTTWTGAYLINYLNLVPLIWLLLSVDSLPYKHTLTPSLQLERHGARFPDHKPRNEMVATIDKLHNAKRPAKHSKLNFVSHYDIRQTLGEEDLVWMGRQQAYNSGKRFFDQYKDLIDNSFPPFYRAPSSPRVIESAQLFQLGFNDDPIWKAYDDLDVIVPEGKAHNNTLDISNCPLASNHSTTIGDDVSDVYASLWTPHWAKWWNDNFPGAKLEHKDIVNLFHTCAFDVSLLLSIKLFTKP